MVVSYVQPVEIYELCASTALGTEGGPRSKLPRGYISSSHEVLPDNRAKL